jgi:hypothetical protein
MASAPRNTACCWKVRNSQIQMVTAGLAGAVFPRSAALIQPLGVTAAVAAVTRTCQSWLLCGPAAPPSASQKNGGDRHHQRARVGLAIAAGSLTTSCCAPKHAALQQARNGRAAIDQLRRLWRGDAVDFPTDGTPLRS